MNENEVAIRNGFTLQQLISAVKELRKSDPGASLEDDIMGICEGYEVRRDQQTELYGHFGLSYNRVTGDWEEDGEFVTDEFPEPGDC